MMYLKYIFIFLVIPINLFPHWFDEKKKKYDLSCDPIDVVIACHKKDKIILPTCINGVRQYVKKVRRIIVVSDEQFTNDAEWFNESQLSFSKKLIEQEFALIDKNFYTNSQKIERVGWYFKQILNFYVAFEIPNISNNILILDADTIFLRSVKFVDSQGNMLHVPGKENHEPYFEHMKKFLPGLKRVYENYSGISHHMLFQKQVLEDLFNLVESHHKCKFWQAYCRSVAPKDIAYSGAADYEIYFNFMLMRCQQIKIRQLKWKNIEKRALIPEYQKNGYHFVSWHHYCRED